MEPESFSCCIPNASWGLLLGVMRQSPLGAIGHLLLEKDPPMKQGKTTRPLSQTLCKGVTLVFPYKGR